MKQATWLAVLLVMGTIFSSYAADDQTSLAEDKASSTRIRLPRIPPTEPSAAAKTLHLQNGFRAELIAAEPLVTDPVAMQYDENGLAYVVEMNDYPYSDKSHDQAWEEQTSEPIGRIRRLEDTDGDGIFDRSTLFADRLSWPSGIALWKGGVYVAATPDVWYFKDTDGDGRADIRRKVFTGFRKYNVQAVMNNFQWGLDHRIYAAGSSNGGLVHAMTKDGQTAKPIRLGRHDFRFDPRTEELEIISGGARFGQTRDDWGNRFLCNIRNPVQHVVLPERYLRRNPFLPVKSAIQDVAASGDAIAVYQISPAEPWRVINARRLAANTATKSPFDSTVPKGYVTSSSGVTIYRGAAYPEEYFGNAFIGEVAGNLVMRYRISPRGVSFAGTRAHEKAEFLASTDNWFRPVNFANAPDGTLHVLDMYRETIEHPWSMPDDLKALVDLTSGRDRGRIYRLIPPRYRAGFQPPPRPRLGSASTAELVAELENPNSWWRDTAHRLLFERQDQTAVPLLRKLLRESGLPVARLHALWSLHGLQALRNEDLEAALADSDPHLREHAVHLAEPRLETVPALLQKVQALSSDENMRVRFQVALSLGYVQTDQATDALARIARRDAADPWVRAAVLSSLSHTGADFLLNVLKDAEFSESVSGREMIGQLAMMVATKDAPGDIDRVLQAAVKSPGRHPQEGRKTVHAEWPCSPLQLTVVRSVGAGLKRSGHDLSRITEKSELPAGRFVARLLNDARRIALSSESNLPLRREAIELLSHDRFESVRETFTHLIDARQPHEIQTAAIIALSSYPRPEVASVLLEKYPSLTPEIQRILVGRLLTRQDWLLALFDAIESQDVPATHISQVRRQIYRKSSNATIRERALKLFADDLPGARKEVVKAYQPALSLSSDPARGAKVFQRECLNCHRFGQQGHDVGPNLATIQNRSPSQLLVNLLDPNREVSPNYLQYIVITKDGRMLTGIVVSETAASMTLRQPEGKQLTILRNEIEQIRSSGISLMPEGLEKKITLQEMADLLAFLLQSASQP